MLMSKGLACAIGVNKCRMYGFSMSTPRTTLTAEDGEAAEERKKRGNANWS
jgi:hypothetical protein